jgi:flagellum-specific ATP synthase
MERYHTLLNTEDLGSHLGTITKVVGTKLESNGPISKIGDICELNTIDGDGTVMAEVVGVEGKTVHLMPYRELDGIGYGSVVKNTKTVLKIPVGEALLGRIVDAMAQPLDGLGPIQAEAWYSVKGVPSNPFDRPRINERLCLGIKAIDGLNTVGKGQRMGIFAGSGVGKSTLMGMMAKTAQADINVIALVGERGREVNEFIERDLGEEGLKRSIVVVATSDQPAMMRSKCALTATTIAEYFKDQGKDVFLMMDSLTRYAMAEREIGLNIGEAPVARGYTPSIYASLPKLLERAGRFQKGSITGLYTVLVEGDDANEPISDIVRGIIDGHLMLSRKLAMQNHYPAIDVLSSISRLMNEICDPKALKAAGNLRQLMAVLQANEDLLSIGAYKSGANTKLDEALRKRSLIENFLMQATHENIAYEATLHQIESIVNG